MRNLAVLSLIATVGFVSQAAEIKLGNYVLGGQAPLVSTNSEYVIFKDKAATKKYNLHTDYEPSSQVLILEDGLVVPASSKFLSFKIHDSKSVALFDEYFNVEASVSTITYKIWSISLIHTFDDDNSKNGDPKAVAHTYFKQLHGILVKKYGKCEKKSIDPLDIHICNWTTDSLYITMTLGRDDDREDITSYHITISYVSKKTLDIATRESQQFQQRRRQEHIVISPESINRAFDTL